MSDVLYSMSDSILCCQHNFLQLLKCYYVCLPYTLVILVLLKFDALNILHFNKLYVGNIFLFAYLPVI